MRYWSSAYAVVPALLFSCMARGPVTRVADGEMFEGRPIAPEAYAAYLRASVLEARGDVRGALGELDRALDEDPESPEIVTRIAGLLCGLRGATRDAAEEALDAFDDALELDPNYAPAWLGLSACREHSGDLAGALEAARNAAYYDPSSVLATGAVARLLFSLRRPTEAWTWLDALVALEPGSREAELSLLDAALGRHDATRAFEARRALRMLGAGEHEPREGAFDEALRDGDLERARSLAQKLRLSPGRVAVRALAARAPNLALEQATLVLTADPSDSDAWIAALAALDELGDEARFADTVRLLDPDPLPPSPEALDALAKLLARRAGREAADLIAPNQRNP